MLFPDPDRSGESTTFFDEAWAGVRAHGLEAYEIVSTSGTDGPQERRQAQKGAGADTARHLRLRGADRMQVASHVAGIEAVPRFNIYFHVVSRTSPDRGISGCASSSA